MFTLTKGVQWLIALVFLSAYSSYLNEVLANDECPSGISTQELQIESEMLRRQYDEAIKLRDRQSMNMIQNKYTNIQKRVIPAYVADQLFVYRLSSNPSCLLGALSRAGAIDATRYELNQDGTISLKRRDGQIYSITKEQLISLAERASK